MRFWKAFHGSLLYVIVSGRATIGTNLTAVAPAGNAPLSETTPQIGKQVLIFRLTIVNLSVKYISIWWRA